MDFLPLISEGDGLPSQICVPCIWRMIEFDDYKRNVHHAEAEIMKILNRSRADANEISYNEEDKVGNAATEEIRLEMVGEAQEVEFDEVADDNKVSIKEEIDIVEHEIPHNILRREIALEISSGLPLELKDEDRQRNQEADEELPNNGMEGNASQCLAGNEESGEDVSEAEGSSVVITQQEQEFLGAQEPNTGRKSRFICDVCGKCFSRKFNFARHSTAHTNERPYSCSRCNKRFKSQEVRKTHELRHNRDQKVKGCKRRGSFKIPSSSSAKPSSVEENRSYGCVNKSGKYACSICGKCFFDSRTLKRHMRCHTNERAFHCPICQKSFKWRSSLMYHLPSHSSKKPFTCKLCQKYFKWESSLRYHLSTHSSEEPFPCSFCGKKFKTKVSKSRHELIHFSGT